MNTEFKQEERYIVFKLSDVEEHFTPGEKQQLARLAEVQRVGRSWRGKPLLKCVVVESDWPEYEPTWKAIEARMTGAQPAPSGEDDAVRKSWARFSNELHRSPDAPYPGMSEAFERHFSQSFTAREWRAESGVWAAAWKAAKNHGAQPAPSVPTTLLVAVADLVAQMEIVSRVGFVDTPNDKDSCAAFCVAEGTWLELMSAVESLASALAAAPEAKP